MRDYPVFRRGIPHSGAGHPRVPQPFATQPAEAAAFDLHALGTPPAFVLSQDQTRHRMGGADFAPRERPTRWMSRFSCQGACGRREAIKNQAVRLAVRPTWRQWVDSPVASSFGASRSRRSSLLWVRRVIDNAVYYTTACHCCQALYRTAVSVV